MEDTRESENHLMQRTAQWHHPGHWYHVHQRNTIHDDNI